METPIRTSAIIRFGNNLIFEQKSDNRLILPGGKCNKIETPSDCLAREIFEEINIEIQVSKFIIKKEFDGMDVLYFNIEAWDGLFIPKEVPILLLPIDYLDQFKEWLYPKFIYSLLLEVI